MSASSLTVLSVLILFTLIETLIFASSGLLSETLKSMSKSSKKPLVSLSHSISKLISEVDLSFLSFDQEVPKKDSKFSTLTIF